jgi:hypothetical protein
LYEAVCLVNQGTDEAVRGLQRLKKASGLTEEVYEETEARLEQARARVNLQFFGDMQASEQKGAGQVEERGSNGSGKESGR